MHYTFKKFGIFFLFLPVFNFAQDFIRVGRAFDFRKDEAGQLFSVDFNRTEEVKEKIGKALKVYNRYYILPSLDINIGEKVSTAENNVTGQIILGRFIVKDPQKDNLFVKQNFSSFEIIPSYTADKEFNERLYYSQIKQSWNFIKSKASSIEESSYVKKGRSYSIGLFSNLGFRESQTLNQDEFYATGGILTELKWQFFKKNHEKIDEEPILNWQIKLSGSGFIIINEQELIYDKPFAGSLNFTIDKNIFDKIIYAGIQYKLGNDTPLYTDLHTLNILIKINLRKK